MKEESTIPVAVIGVGCRFPGDVDSPSKLWDLLQARTNTWSHVPADRYNEQAFLHPHADDANGSHNHVGGHFLSGDVREFDNDFFNISSQEAAAMDPQQRLLLETVYEALESAGQEQDKIRGSNTSVNVAMFTRDYDRNIFKDTLNLPRHQVVGNGEAILANRISHAFDLRGPSITLDTGCSGGLVAVHQACQCLKLGDVDMAIAGAANLILSPDHQIGMSNLHMLNADGRSYPFDSRGSGYGRGEGTAALVLKRLDRAVAARDPIRAVILGSAVNQDGRTTAGITYPSGFAQTILQQELYKQLKIDPHSIAYVEAHGTGTIAGDREEIDALSKTFSGNRTSPLYVGSIKSNIGHLESTSGLAGLIKCILILEHGQIAPNADFVREKDGLRLKDRNIIVPDRVDHVPPAFLSRVSVNSFGYGGTNAHVVLESPLHTEPAHPLSGTLAEIPPMQPQLFVFSAKTPMSLTSSIRKYHAWLSAHGAGLSLSSLSHTLRNRRSHYPCRLSCVAKDHVELVVKLEQASKNPSRNTGAMHIPINFVFTGQGAQWPQMGRQLLVAEPTSVFTESLRRSRDLLLGCGAGWDLIEEILRDADATRIHSAELAQPATTAIQIALVDALENLNVSPSAVIGHSSGEISAAYAAGFISHSAALRISFYRGLAPGISRKKGYPRGAMLVVGAGEEELIDYLHNVTEGTVSVACVNSPRSSTISGDEGAIRELAAILTSKDIFNRILQVDTAYHSYHMRAAAQEYKDSLGLITTKTAKPVKFFSTVHATEMVGPFDADYWAENLVSKVRFQQAMQNLCDAQAATRQVFVEIGPHNALAGPTRQCIAGSALDHDYLSPLQRGKHALQGLLEVVGRLFEHGHPVNFSTLSSFELQQEAVSVLPDLPSYCWDHSKKHWHESRLSRDYRLRKHPYHDLLGVRSPESTSIEPRWRHIIDAASLPWLADHVVDGLTVFPGAGYLCMAIEAISQLARDKFPDLQQSQIILRDVEFSKALLIADSPHRTEAQLSFNRFGIMGNKNNGLQYHFLVAALNHDQTWDEHCRGNIELAFVATDGYDASNDVPSKTKNCPDLGKMISGDEFYQQLRSNGNAYGPSFMGVKSIVMNDDHATVAVAIPSIVELMPAQHMQPHTIHPSTLDMVMHASLALAARKFAKGSIMPVRIKEFVISPRVQNRPGEVLSAHVDVTSACSRTAAVDIEVYNDYDTQPSLSLSGVELRLLEANGTVGNSQRNICWEMSWDLDADFLSSKDFHKPKLANKDSNSLRRKHEVLNRATTHFVRKCLSSTREGQLKIREEYRALFRWMVHHQRQYDSFNKSEITSIDDGHPALCSGSGVAELDLLSRIGTQLPAIVSGTVVALDLVIEDDLLYRAYNDDSSTLCYDLLRQYVKHLCFKKSGIRVLEIGAGTAGATLPFLETLKDNGYSAAVYDFTDISSGFFDRAASLLAEYPINYKRLDIEEDPEKQGFKKHSYDIILACNCLHATSRIRTTLQNVGSLLRADGRLVLVEMVNPQPYHHITFGTLPGYWKGSADGRSDGPFMSVEGWCKALKDTRLEMQLSVNDDDVAHICSLMIASPFAEEAWNADHEVKIITLRDESAQFALGLQAEFQQEGIAAAIETFGHDVHDGSKIQIVLDDGNNPLLSELAPDAFHRVCAMLRKQSRIIWVSGSHDPRSFANPKKHLITGLSRSAHAENDNLRLITVDIQQELDHENRRLLGCLHLCLRRSFLQPVASTEREFIIRDDSVRIPRLLPSHAVNACIANNHAFPPEPCNFTANPLTLSTGNADDRTGPVFSVDETHRAALAEDEIQIQVRATSVPPTGNQRPCFHEYSGVVIAKGSQVTDFTLGDRVMAISAIPCASMLRVLACHAICISDEISFTAAAALPLALMVACYILFDLVDVQSSSRIAIQSIGDPICQAISVVARHCGASIVVLTSGPSEPWCKRDELGPTADCLVQLDHLSRKSALRSIGKLDAIISRTSSTISKYAIGALQSLGSVIILQDGGKKALDFTVPPNTTLHALDFDAFLHSRPQKAMTLFKRASSFIALAYASLSTRGSFPRKAIDIAKIHDVVAVASSDRGGERVVLEVHDHSLVPVIRTIGSRSDLNSGTFIVAGGLGDLGRRLVAQLAAHGAEHVVTISRRLPSKADLEHLETVIRVHDNHSKVFHIQCDIAHEDQVKAAAATVASMGLPPIKGVIQSTIGLHDRTLDSMSLDDFKIPLETKVRGTLNLQEVFCTPRLEFFLMLSSAANIIGTSGQANYNAGNAVQDAIAHSSIPSGCHYLAFSPGMIEGTSVIRGNETRLHALRRAGFTPISEDEIERMLEYLFSSTARKHRPAHIVTGFDAQSLSHAASANGNIRSAMFTHVFGLTEAKMAVEETIPQRTFRDMLVAYGPSENLLKYAAGAVKEKLSSLMAIDAGTMNLDKPIFDFGLDSLIAIELRNWIRRDFEASLQSLEILDGQSIRALAELIVKRSQLVEDVMISRPDA